MSVEVVPPVKADGGQLNPTWVKETQRAAFWTAFFSEAHGLPHPLPAVLVQPTDHAQSMLAQKSE